MEPKRPKVLNSHWYGGADKLPSDAVYIGRPGPWGNPYSSASGKYTREECVALHRVEVYRSCIGDQSYLLKLREALGGHDVACWCKQPNRVKACHGDTYIHVLSDSLKDRVYDKSITHYLMDDLRRILKAWDTRIKDQSGSEDYLSLFIHLGDVRLQIQYGLLLAKDKYVFPDDWQFFLATLIVDLESAFGDDDPSVIAYRFDHVIWVVDRFITNRQDRLHEPTPPYLSLKGTTS